MGGEQIETRPNKEKQRGSEVFMSDNLIIAESQQTCKTQTLKKTRQYVAALYEVGCEKFSKDKRGIVIDGRPKNWLLDACIRTELRNLGLKYSAYWLNDTIGLLAANNANLATGENIPGWMDPFFHHHKEK